MELFRNIYRNWKWFGINTLGLSVAFACIFLAAIFVRFQLSFDRFHTKADRIYRVTVDDNRGASSMHPARVIGDWTKKLVSDYPVIEKMVRLTPFRSAVVRIGEQKFYSENIFATDSTFFDVFDFKVLAGNPKAVLTQPNCAIISRKLALKYFGKLDVIGKEITILPQQEPKPMIFTINGVMEDFPLNSHFHADLLTSFSALDGKESWAYSYYLIKKDADISLLKRSVEKQWKKTTPTSDPVAKIFFQKITDIHLYSHKTRELEPNGNVRSLILIMSGAFIIFFIALLNFLNLSRVEFIANSRKYKIKLIHGASKNVLSRNIALNSIFLSLLSVVVGCILTSLIGNYLGVEIFIPSNKGILFLMILISVVIVALLSITPIVTSKLTADTKLKAVHQNVYALPLIVQFILAIIAISCTLVLTRQMNYINNQHPEARNGNMIVSQNNSFGIIHNYDVLKRELLSLPGVLDMTSALEGPGGDILDNCEYEMEGVDKKKDQTVNILTTDANFFEMMNIKPLAGSVLLGFTPSLQWEADAYKLNALRSNKSNENKRLEELQEKVGDYREQYVINFSALKMLGLKNPNDAIGKRFRLNFFIPELFPEGTVVAVVPDFHYTNMHSLEKALVVTPRKMYNSCFIIKIDSMRQKETLASINRIWQKINPDFPFSYSFISESYQRIYTDEIAQTRVLSLFAIMAILLSTLGVYAMVSFNIQRKVKEIGIRKVNGASRISILLMLNRKLMVWVGIAIVFAVPVAYYATYKWLENFAYKTDLSWWIFALAGLLTLGIVLITVSWQSWRAATRNPVEALRYE